MFECLVIHICLSHKMIGVMPTKSKTLSFGMVLAWGAEETEHPVQPITGCYVTGKRHWVGINNECQSGRVEVDVSMMMCQSECNEMCVSNCMCLRGCVEEGVTIWVCRS